MDIQETLHRAEQQEVVLAKSGWFSDPSADELEQAYADFERRFEEFLPQFISHLGEPDLTDETSPELCEDLYCEAARLAGWKHKAGYLLLACGQHDQETPVFVSVSYRES